MLTAIGQVEAIFRYPVKSMAGEPLAAANLGWHGLDGDRRLAFRRIDNHSDFPWLTASKLPELLLFAPHRDERRCSGRPSDAHPYPARRITAGLQRRLGGRGRTPLRRSRADDADETRHLR